jgi:hypothetical protein
MPLKDQQVRALLLACRDTDAEEIDCEQLLLSMAEYAEARVGLRAVPESLAKVVAHEQLCANCREECRALIELLRADPSLPAQPNPLL